MPLRSIIALVLLPFCGISSAQDQTPHVAPSDSVRIYVYRYKQYAGLMLTPSIYCDETRVAESEPGRMVVLGIPPGKHRFRSTDKQAAVELDLKPGQEYYIRIDLVLGLLIPAARVALVQGAAEVKNMKPLDVGMIKAKSFVADDFVPTKRK